MGARCIFDCLVAFVGLVGLYACSVRRLRTEKRKAANLLNCFAPMFSALAVASCVVVALLLFFVCFDWVVGCGSFSLRSVSDAKRGANCVPPRLCVLVG